MGTIPGGRRVTFLLDVTVLVVCGVRTLRVRESEPRWLPEFCPGRHVNADGSFCLERRPIPAPTTPEAARLWWRLIFGYLELQIETDLLGDWDARHEWPHGDAAHLLAQAEDMEAGLPASVIAIARQAGVPVAPTAECPCGEGRRANRCHLKIINEIRALRNAADARERDFWSAVGTVDCCGTLKVCPLRARTAVYLRSSAGRVASRFV
jgi:hypothetical protein